MGVATPSGGFWASGRDTGRPRHVTEMWGGTSRICGVEVTNLQVTDLEWERPISARR